jgi:type I restriction enzyme R subunit
LIQAYSRTNRILNEVKSQGNIVCFRNLKKATDDAITLFSNPEAIETIIMEPYEAYVKKFNKALKDLRKIAPTVDSVNELASEVEELAFVKAFRTLIRLKNILSGFSDFTFADLEITEQEFEDYKSKYLDIYDKVKTGGEGETTSIINVVDFELELIQRDEVNVAYILQLLSDLYKKHPKDAGKKANDALEKKKQAILDLLGNDVKLRSKRELIEKFINENLPRIKKHDDIKKVFVEYWNDEKKRALEKLSAEEHLISDKLKPIIDDYLFTGHTPLRETVYQSIQKDKQPKILERKTVTERIIHRIKNLIRTFEDDIGDLENH